ncbi:TniQ family protein [Paraburkholderia hospita]|uniref:TniQ family protein n=1 Tax=Paraburkholderia hospita TaxID=169430 RepID=UPI003ECEBAB6
MITSSTRFRPPLCRPKILQDEWIETYLFRVARANGIRHPRLSDAERIRPTLPATALSKPDGYPIWGGLVLPRWSMVNRANKIRYCPECMAESRHVRSRWRIREFEVCTIHHIRLKDDLAEPVMTRGYAEEGKCFIADVTEEQLWAGAICPMPRERRAVEGLWADFERSIVENDIPRALENISCILFLKALLDAIETTLDEPEFLQIGLPRWTRMFQLVEQFKYPVTPNLDGIRTFLAQITVVKHRYVVLARLRRMLTDEAERPTCLSNLPVAELRTRFLNDGRKWPDAPARGLVHVPHDRPEMYVSFDRAESLIGCSTRFLQHAVRSNIFPGWSVVQYGIRRYTFLPVQAVEACRKWYSSLATREQVLNELHIDGRNYAALLGAGLLCPIGIANYTLFHRTALNDLCGRLDGLSRPFPAMVTHLRPLFGSWMFGKGITKAISQKLLEEAFSGKFPIFRQQGNPGLSAYFVDHAAVDRAYRLRRVESAKRTRQAGMESVCQLSLLP